MTRAMRPDLNELLRSVSRSFYLTLRVLPGAIRPQIGLAYLLARATDTIADTDLVSPEERVKALAQLRDRILDGSRESLDLSRFMAPPAAASDPVPSERILLQRINTILAVLPTFSSPDQERIRSVLETITSGQMLDLKRFADASSEHVIALQTDEELDDYTYRVAGTVGEFWTKLCLARLLPSAKFDEAQLLRNGIRFGKGLQCVNILRDLARDLQSGRCYIPETRLAEVGLTPASLLDPANESRFRPVYDAWLDRATAHLEAGWSYTNALPYGQVRLRLACSWPVLIGIATIRKLRTARVLDASQRVKVSRAEITAILRRSVLLYPWRSRWEALFHP